MLRQSLRSLPNVNAIELLECAGIDSTRRAEELDVQAFVALARAYQRMTAKTRT
jgi:16S rRNA A1518/A1519 N6-dimethyltransferase RsmA/KsgA/DIM1 with predicted DNA glycosylase/AP lyase activity